MERGAGAGEPVRVWPGGERAAPSEFVWRGQRYLVRSAEPEDAAGSVFGRTPLRFRVRTTSGLRCILAHDLRAGLWRMDRLVPSGGRR
jgi:hypothetical protein